MDRNKGKQPVGQSSDEELALQLWEEELDNYNRSLEDERLARSIARAVVDDGVAVTTARQEELRASDDHRLALELSGQPVPPPQQPQPHDQSVAVQLSEDKMKDYIDLTLADTDFDLLPTRVASQHAEAESSRNPKRCCIAGPSNEGLLYECAVCTELVPSTDIIPAPCSHTYCRICAVRLFQDSMTDETLFPPRCCRKEIPLSLVSGFLGLARSQQFEEKAIEFSDPHRTYCSNPSCSEYIFPYSVSSYIGTCSHCSSRTCMRCKKPAHEGDCPDEDEELLQLAEREGWRRCFQCRNMIELGTGCNHITCRCGAEFCYACGTKWRQCRCELWDENRLVDRARYLVDRGRDPAQPAQPARPEQVQQMVQRLLERHECDHEEFWPRVPGAHQCEECRDHLPNYILQCGQCGIRACRRCRLNRL
ncbi:BRcat and Rcat domain-containing protein [Aspergillus fischeri NRRL 181]|uniref:RBR-type E3 ubiquitin transferase n=1 Tax=Neosartorya fischeri (strain ATCC 1020 / DSM 3700 / CBS 544.65 / FGSC A1164 / JCM 1740 / NRRL 181 / WB 181) TaxID=331117 RepID=A1DMT8_NEOFI|nr:IBR domain protein [Aspergillus fischeri NRRL 181]EAW16109.1 IBR domain protein [Aspergillus fischeri NRRL 181]